MHNAFWLDKLILFIVHSIEQGKLFFFLGIQMFMIQAFLVRRIKVDYYLYMLVMVRIVCLSLFRNALYRYSYFRQGIFLLIPSFIFVGFSSTPRSLYLSLVPYAFSSATVVPTLSTIFSTYGPDNQKGVILGIFRSIGALARALGPITASLCKLIIWTALYG